MMAARNPKPNPASVTTRARAKPERGMTSPRPRVKKAGLAARRHHGGPGAILHEAEAKHEANSPNPDENQERERTVETQQGFTGPPLRDEAHYEFPHGPGGAVKQASKAELSRDAAGQDDGLERIPEHDKKDRDTCNERSWS